MSSRVEPQVTPRIHSLALWVAIGASAMAFIAAAAELRARFPSSYTWSELLISYEGGFVRRGLAGELGFLFDPLIGVRLSITGALLVGYLLVNTAVIVLVCRRPSFAGWLCVASPGLIPFPLWDFRAFGRKDIVILTAFALSIFLIKRVSKPWSCFAALTAIYTVAGLVHETAWIYFVAAIGTMLLLRSDDAATRRRVALASVVCLALWTILVVAFKGSADQTVAMVQAWTERYPQAYDLPGAAEFLGQPISASVSMVGYHLGHIVTSSGFVVGFVLTGIPVMLFARERWSSVVSPGRTWIVPVVLVAMLVPFVIANDWGRYIYLFWMHVLLFCAVVGSPLVGDPSERSELGGGHSLTRRRLRPLLAGGVLLLYALSWHVAHFAPRGVSPLEPGPLLWWM